MTSDNSFLSSEQRRLLSDAIVRRRRFADIESSRSAMAYLNHVVIDCRPSPKLFREVADPWQWTLLSRVVPALEAVVGLRPDYSGPRSFWWTLPRGSDKSSSIARLLNWALAYSKHPLRAIAAAGDRDQANFIWEFSQSETLLNPWLAERLEHKNWKVIGRDNGSRLKIITADANSSYGLREDVLILDELTHWGSRALFDTVLSGRQKVSGSLLLIITNAGIRNSWQWQALQEAKQSLDWSVYEAPHILASWVSKDKIDETRRMLPRSVARRVLDNQWVSDNEDNGFVTRAEVEACVEPSLSPRSQGLAKHSYIAAIDYGPKRDRTALCIVHYEPDEGNRVVLDQLVVFEGKNFPSGRVAIDAVERWIDEARKNFPDLTVVFDPYQMEATAQRYQGAVRVVRFEPRGGKSNYIMAANLRSLIANQRLALYRRAGEVLLDSGGFHSLEDELVECVVKNTSYGWRLDHESSGHDDRVVALGMACHQAITQAQTIEIATDERWF